MRLRQDTDIGIIRQEILNAVSNDKNCDEKVDNRQEQRDSVNRKMEMLEIKLIDIKKAICRLIIKLDTGKEIISKLEDMSIQMSQMDLQKEKK